MNEFLMNNFYLRGFFFIKSNFSFEVGTIFPNKNPQGLNDSIWSKITLRIAVRGMERNIPGMPHKALPINTTIIEIKAFIFTLDATMRGIIK